MGVNGTSEFRPTVTVWTWVPEFAAWNPVQSHEASDASGAYDLGGLVPGQAYRLEFSACCLHMPEFFDSAKTVETATSVTAPASGINATLELGGQLVGQVTDKDGTPLSGVAVGYDVPPFNSSWTRVKESGPDGSFRIGMLETGSYRICFADIQEPSRFPFECYLHATRQDDTPTLVSVTQGHVTDLGQVRLGVPVAEPRIEGSLRVGQVLTIDTDTAIPASVDKSYRWYANGSRIKGASGKRLRLTKALRGKRISVRVYGKGTGELLLQLKVTKAGRVR